MTTSPSSVTDKPITSVDEESLDVLDYSEAMVEFIAECSTPLTIGVQGEWGSGKTSMLNIIRGMLHDRDIATAWVNTWEYAMFRESGEIVPAVLRGLLEGLEAECKAKGHWPDSLSGRVDRIAGAMKSFARFALDVGVKKATGKDNFSGAMAESSAAGSRAEIAEVKADIASVIDTVVNDPGNPHKKVIFFIDDLDRIDPAVAVAVLEALKNIFDITHCVFVLAIDYEIVVKGLESKFGPKTEANEREFRSFFDKIIQVPFSMPVSAYNIEKLLADRLEGLGFAVGEDLMSAYRDLLYYTVGANPRGIKRYINTYSLLKKIGRLNRGKSESPDAIEDYALFALIGLQIAYPKIYQLIIKNPDYVSWDASFADSAGLEVAIPEAYKSNELYDEFWEQLIWSFCQADTYLKIRCSLVLNAMNLIRRHVTDDRLDDVLSDCLQIANITSVDDSDASKQEKFQRVRLDGIEAYSKGQLERGIRKETLALIEALHGAITSQDWDSGMFVNYTPKDISFNADIKARRKVFVYLSPRKKSVKVFLFGESEQLDIGSLEEIGSELFDHIRQAYRALTKETE
jgi:hypothetical protein